MRPGLSAPERERETTPAPPSSTAIEMSEPSLLPTSVPAFDVTTMAESSALRRDAREAARLPADVTIPVRTTMRAPEDLPHRLAFMLVVVDGRTSVADIAATNGMPIAEVLASFMDLFERGLVELAAGHAMSVPTSRASSPELPPSSGRRR